LPFDLKGSWGMSLSDELLPLLENEGSISDSYGVGAREGESGALDAN